MTYGHCTGDTAIGKRLSLQYKYTGRLPIKQQADGSFFPQGEKTLADLEQTLANNRKRGK